MIILELTADRCADVISANRLGRLACCHDNRPYVVPIHYAYADNFAYAFTMPGRKLETMRANPNVALLVELEGERRGWTSVLAEGRFEELPDVVGFKLLRDRAWSLLSKHANWWEPGGLKPVLLPPADHSPHVFFRVSIDRLSGREAVDE